MGRTFLLAFSSLVATGVTWGAETPERLGLAGETLEVGGRPAFVLLPEESLRRSPQPWIYYAPTLPAYPDVHEAWMHAQFLAAGIAVAGIDVGESYGNALGRGAFDAFYEELTGRRDFAKRPCLLARSRGGLWMASWAVDHPDRVAGLAGIYPVFDLRSYPGLDKAAPAYGLSPQALGSSLAEHNPIERVAALAGARVPAFLIHGDKDEVVPLAANSGRFAAIYADAGAAEAVTLVVVPGGGHDFWDGYFRCQPLVDFAVMQAQAGAAEPAGQ